ncbi:MAG: hypothetical protein JWM68_829 [Verrucomicrobiales bacterium]|nr:hypothetical protein [Verrucomicrobiales bacterium]
MAFVNFLGLTAKGQLEPLKVRAQGIYFHGNVSDIDCSIHLMFLGAMTSNAMAMSFPHRILAIDNTGKDLVKTIPGFRPHPQFRRTFEGAFWEMIELKGPSPQANEIQRLEADVDFFTPTTSNGGRVVLENFMSKPGKPLQHPALDRYKIKLTYHTMESFESWRGEHPSQYVKTDVEYVRDHFSGILGKSAAFPRKYVAIQIDDPETKLLKLDFERSDKHSIQTSGHKGVESIRMVADKNEADFSFFYFNEVPPPDLHLVVYLSVPEAIETTRFKLEHIALPERPKPLVSVDGAKKK